jgi:hypothetical protein
LSTQQLVAIVMLVVFTALNSFGVRVGKWIQNTFTSAKTLSLIALIVLGIVIGRQASAVRANFGEAMFTPSAGALPLLVVLCVAQVGSLFSSDAWNNITFTAGEVKDPRRNIPLSLALGVGIVIAVRARERGVSLHAAARADPVRARRPRCDRGAADDLRRHRHRDGHRDRDLDAAATTA